VLKPIQDRASGMAAPVPAPAARRASPNRWPGVLQVELRRLVEAVDRLHEQRRNEHEALPMLLKRVTSIERRLGIVEVPVMPRPSRRYPTGL
jgi:hypothetical protein